MTDAWFTTSPEAILRAESVLTAFYEDRPDDLAAALLVDLETGSTTNAWHLVVALIGIADRMVDAYATVTEREHLAVLREAARVVAEAYYSSTNNPENGEAA